MLIAIIPLKGIIGGGEAFCIAELYQRNPTQLQRSNNEKQIV